MARVHERRLQVVGQVDVDVAVVHEHARDAHAVAVAREDERRGVLEAAAVDLGPGGQEQTDGVRVAAAAGCVEGGVSAVAHGVDLRAGGEQLAYGTDLPRPGGHPEPGALPFVARVHVRGRGRHGLQLLSKMCRFFTPRVARDA